MKNIQFTPPSNLLILQGIKEFTARFWSNNYPIPKKGEIVTASTGRKKETRFAKLEIIQVTTWEPGVDDALMLTLKTGYSPQVIAEKEGFKNFDEFFDAYAALNNHLDPNDPNRKHYFIEFRLVEKLKWKS